MSLATFESVLKTAISVVFHASWICSNERTLCFSCFYATISSRGEAMDPKLTGNIIAEKRKALGLNQIQLAERLNVSNRTISKWENGDGYPDITMLCDIADCLDITIDELLTGKTPASMIIEAEKPCAINKDKQKYIFSVLFSISICLSVFSALLGGITELYSMWAFNILFYTHWEIMFSAVSLLSLVASAIFFIIGTINLKQNHSNSEIIKLIKNKALFLTIISCIFPLTFLARILDVSRYGVYMPYVMVIAVAVLVIAIAKIFKRINDYGEKN